MLRIAWVVVVLALALALVMAVMRPHEDEGGAPEPTAAEVITGGVVPIFLFELPPGLADQPLPIPDDNPMLAEKILLGEWLFFDVRLSETKRMSCETCHVSEQGWADGLTRSPKHDGSLNVRHTPSLYGAGFFSELYWDGRAQGLEVQVRAVWEGQMGARPARIAAELGQMSGYRGAFQEAFGGPPTADRIVDALTTFIRTIHAGDTPWDRHPKDEAALDETEVGRGGSGCSRRLRSARCVIVPRCLPTPSFITSGLAWQGRRRMQAGRRISPRRRPEWAPRRRPTRTRRSARSRRLPCAAWRGTRRTFTTGELKRWKRRSI